MSYDLVSHFVTGVAVIPAAARVANHTGPAVDLINGEGQATLTLFGIAAATAVVTMEESDDNSAWVALAAPATALVVGRQLPINVPITASQTVFEANFTRSRRFVRVVITGTNHNLAGTIKCAAKYIGS
jgi:hypothetical protein